MKDSKSSQALQMRELGHAVALNPILLDSINFPRISASPYIRAWPPRLLDVGPTGHCPRSPQNDLPRHKRAFSECGRID